MSDAELFISGLVVGFISALFTCGILVVLPDMADGPGR